MKNLFILLFTAFFISSVVVAQAPASEIYLVIRADDIGSSHAANLACIKSYREGIVKSVEIMPTCSWFPEAARMLRENPEYDVGVHLTLTSEWDNVKWGPLTTAPSLVDKDGYFFPKTRTPAGSPERIGFWDESVNLAEVEAEVRAQIELAVDNIPQVTHISGHMGCSNADPRVAAIVDRLAKEYGIDINLEILGFKSARWGASNSDDFTTRESKFISMLESLEPGRYMLIEHPALDTPEMEGHGHEGYRNVNTHRDAVTRSFCSSKVKEVIVARNIKLISYREAQELFGK